MVRSRNWPDLWWQISKIRDIQVVGIYDLMKRWRFETNRISSVATAQPQSQKPVFDFDLTWWPDLWWPGVEIFTQGVKFNCEQVLKKWRRCAPPFFRYSRKTGGEGIFCPPPPVRVLTRALLGGGRLNAPPPPSGFSRIAKIRRRAAPPGFHPPYPPSFPQLLWKFRPKAMWGQVTRSGQVTQLQNNFPILPRPQCFRESYETFGIWWGHQCLQNAYLGILISVTSGQVIFATSPL